MLYLEFYRKDVHPSGWYDAFWQCVEKDLLMLYAVYMNHALGFKTPVIFSIDSALHLQILFIIHAKVSCFCSSSIAQAPLHLFTPENKNHSS